ncbi:hypothetical protein N7468_006899 [Penicillium chermesinum]|uniref:CBM21 domain-containing protein n=1 Tax=Penicillium chermesinum TaxID=63820 RepID=A0A9W9NT68_9EURO|nr:uncharacterized protein N7468_006899 [Penicillium chermesinum]KAJ5225674.1 hypothetical protein N7468_006899 [Penicillium chermesinum]
MPYTAPLNPEAAERPAAPRSASARLQTSRSYSSTSYVRRHRRSPSISKAPLQPAPIDPHASLRQSPPPLSNAGIPPGAVISPPESAPNSSDEESPRPSEGINIEELEAAVKAIEQRKDHFDQKMGPADAVGAEAQPSSSQPTRRPPPVIAIPIVKPHHLRLSKEARKISHSRSATESCIPSPHEEALTSSPDDSDEDSSSKPPMVRKKSGELVRPALRPASARRRPSSMPGTPVISKAVHFDSHLEHIRHFLQLDRPLAVSAETSPVDSHDDDHEFPFGREENSGPSWEWALRLMNFPDVSSRPTAPVRLEKLSLSTDKNVLFGSVAVANLAFQKSVAARFTFDHWKTVSEVGAVFSHDQHSQHAHDGYDRFSFEIKLNDQTNLEQKTLFICIRYNVNGQEFWDNHNGSNFQAGFHKVPKPRPTKASGAPRRPTLPRSRTFTGSNSGRPLSMPPSFNDIPEPSQNVPFSNPFSVPTVTKLTRTPSDDIDNYGPPKRREKPSKQAFGNRYDFGASLSAAMQTKSPLDRTTLTARARSGSADSDSADAVGGKVGPSPGQSSMSDTSTNGSPVKDSKSPPSVSTKPWLQSSGYRELVDKYCFYGSPKSDSTKQSFTVNVPREEMKLHSSGTPSPPLSPGSSASQASPPVETARDTHASMRSASPSFRTSPRASPSPKSHLYPYQQKTLQNGFMSDSPSSPVIRG